MDPAIQVTILIASILLSAFFSGVEIAFVSANKFKLELDKSRDTTQGNILKIITKSPSRLIGTLLIGNNICLVLYGMVFEGMLKSPLENWFEPLFGDAGKIAVLLSTTFISTGLILITGEFLPKALFRINPNPTFNFFALPVLFFHYLLALLVKFTVWISKIILKYIFRAKMEEEIVTFERTDLNYYLRQMTEKNNGQTMQIDNEVQILQNALEFPTIKAKECMVPRPEIVAIESKDSIDELKQIFIRTGLSKIMVYRDTMDDIIGYVHSFDMFKQPKSVTEITMPLLIVPETMFVKDILTQFIQHHRSVAVVVDEYGGTAGILTTEDIIEEIIGDIEDEHDHESFTEKRLDNDCFLFSARLEIDYINDKYGLNLPDSEEYETLAGLVLSHTQEIPKAQDKVTLEDLILIVKKVSESRIEEVEIRPNSDK